MNLFSSLIDKEREDVLSEIHKDYEYYEIEDELGDTPKGLKPDQLVDYISRIEIFINFDKEKEYLIFITPDWDLEHLKSYIRKDGEWSDYELK